MKTFAKVLCVILGILIIISGFVCLFNPTATYSVIGWCVGFSMILDAIGRFFTWWEAKKVGLADGWMLAGAIISAVLGFFIVNNMRLQVGIDAFLAYYVAIWFIVAGVFLIVRAMKVHKLHKNWDTKMLGKHWYLPLVIGALLLIFGVLCCFKPLVMTNTIGIFMSIGIILMGADLITLATTPEVMLVEEK